MLCPVQEVGQDVTGDGARDGELDDGKQDVKLSRIKRKQFFFWPDMLVASKKRTQRFILFHFYFLKSRYFRATSTYTTKTHGLGRPNCLLKIEYGT